MSDLSEVISEIKSILNSSKEQVTIHSLCKDYELILNSKIPFRKLGFNSVGELLQKIPNLKQNQVGNQTYLDLRPDEKIAHIAKLVAEQNSKKKPKKRFSNRLPPPKRGYTSGGSSYGSGRNFRSGSSYGSGLNSRSFSHSSSYNSRNYSNSGDNKRQSNGGYRDYGRARENGSDYSRSRCRGSQRTEYDFSDHEIEYEATGFTDEESPEETEPCSYPVKPSASEQAPVKRFENLSVTVSNSSLGAGRGDRISCMGSSLSQRLSYDTEKRRDVSGRANKPSNCTTALDDWDDTVPDTDNSDYKVAAAADDWDDSVECDGGLPTSLRNGSADCNGSTRAPERFVADASDWDDSVVPCESPEDATRVTEPEEDQCPQNSPRAESNRDSSRVNGLKDVSVRPTPVTDSKNSFVPKQSPGDLQGSPESAIVTLAKDKPSYLKIRMRKAAEKSGVRLVIDFKRVLRWGLLDAYLDHEIESW